MHIYITLLHSQLCPFDIGPAPAAHIQSWAQEKPATAVRLCGWRGFSSPAAANGDTRLLHPGPPEGCIVPVGASTWLYPRWAMPLLLWRTCSHVTYYQSCRYMDGEGVYKEGGDVAW